MEVQDVLQETVHRDPREGEEWDGFFPYCERVLCSLTFQQGAPLGTVCQQGEGAWTQCPKTMADLDLNDALSDSILQSDPENMVQRDFVATLEAETYDDKMESQCWRMDSRKPKGQRCPGHSKPEPNLATRDVGLEGEETHQGRDASPRGTPSGTRNPAKPAAPPPAPQIL
ncbi:hypothetical protein Z043_108291 [Scleropages formosus]|uniref:Uncharacterized protein n=1 Tax=Scleropages formosus TaxID=113540 RepID=A0A0P7UT29_SCLFO|nr:hypothetical protein Z043_108291 [Scleropages formosus]